MERKPVSVRCDNGPEYVGNTLIIWTEQQNIRLNFIQPGKLQQNAYIERYNRTVRYDWLGQHFFRRWTSYRNMPQNGNGSIVMND